jgi:hypothetical protein
MFLGIADDTSPLTLGTVDLRASEASMAMREAILMPWPPQAIGFRLLDLRRIGGGAKGNGRANVRILTKPASLELDSPDRLSPSALALLGPAEAAPRTPID